MNNYHDFDMAQRTIKESMKMQEQFIKEMLNLQNKLIALNIKTMLEGQKIDKYA